MLEFRNVSKRFGRTAALDGLTLRCEPGQVLGLLGPNGAGKSTAVGLAAGVLTPDTGAVQLGNGADPMHHAARKQLGVAFQLSTLYERLTARENILLFARIAGLSRGHARERAAQMLEWIGLAQRADEQVRTFSIGMQRRLNVAVAAVHRPTVLLVDEPTAGVDPRSRGLILDLIGELRDGGAAILFTTHDLTEVDRICDAVAIIDRGRLVASGTIRELIARFAPGLETSPRRTGYEQPSAQNGAGLEHVYLSLTDPVNPHEDVGASP